MKTYPATLRGACLWAVETAGLDGRKLKEEHVRVYLKDGRDFLLKDAFKPTPDDWSPADILSVRIKHPDATELIELALGRRQ